MGFRLFLRFIAGGRLGDSHRKLLETFLGASSISDLLFAKDFNSLNSTLSLDVKATFFDTTLHSK